MSAGEEIGEIASEAFGLSQTAGSGGAGGGAAGMISEVTGALEGESADLASGLKSQVESFVPGDISSTQRVFQGRMSDLVLGKMGALGATVGDDIFLKSDLSGVQRASVAAHELTHTTQAQGMTLQAAETEAYDVESKVREAFDGVQLAAEQPRDARGDDPVAEIDKKTSEEVSMEALAEATLYLFQEEEQKRDILG